MEEVISSLLVEFQAASSALKQTRGFIVKYNLLAKTSMN